MFLGHYALAFGVKRLAPEVSLGTWFLACQFADLLWPTLLLLGYEAVEIDPGNTAVTPLNFVRYPYSHSLVMLALWSALFALLYRAAKGWRPNAISVLSALVFSHFVLDFITHRPDLPITVSGSRRVGLGLWNSLTGTLAAESLMFIAGLVIYTSVTRARDRAGAIGLWSLTVLLVAIYISSVLGPPPPSAAAVAGAGHALWLFVVWGYWLDRHRTSIIRSK